MKSTFAVCVVLALLLAGCVAKPEDIVPQAVSGQRFAGIDCAGLQAQKLERERQLAAAEAAQRKTRSRDAASLMIIGLPSTMLGETDRSGEIARLKGELAALDGERRRNSC